MSMRDLEFYLRRKDSRDIVYDLAQCLKDGTLAVMIGAGASKPLGLPDWPTLVKACVKASKVDVPRAELLAAKSGEALFDIMGIVHDSFKGQTRKYLDLVRSCLYPKADWSMADAPPLLRALGCLAMGSYRGRARTFISYNFDSVLEEYFAYHGYLAQVIDDVPTLIGKSDVAVWHPHGFLPRSSHVGAPSKRIVFDCDTAERFLESRQEPWKDALRYLFGSNVFLAVGISGEDKITNVMLTGVADTLKTKRPLGFWLYRKGTATAAIERKWINRGFVPLPFTTYEDIPPFLFSICQRAARPVLT